jgi:hypothetical protein
MQKKSYAMAVLAIAAILAMPVMAQTPPIESIGTGDEPRSNTKIATGLIFTNDVDNFINYHKYSAVLTGDAKWFAFVTGKPVTGIGGTGYAADLGYARNFGSLYLGAWYRGNIAYLPTNGGSVISSITPTWDNDREVLLQTTETTSYTAKNLTSTNNIEFLIGVAGQGIKVGFFESYVTDQNPANTTLTVIDYQDGRKDYTNAAVEYKSGRGFLRPYIGWGSNFAIGDANLMPYVNFNMGIYNDTQINDTENYTEVNGVKQAVVGQRKGVNHPVFKD